MDKLGFIGIGAMGRPMATNLVNAGYSMTVYDVVSEAMRPLVDLGAHAAGSVGEVSDSSDIIFTMLPNSPEVEEVILGPGGIIQNGREGMMVVDTSTIYPESTDKNVKKSRMIFPSTPRPFCSSFLESFADTRFLAPAPAMERSNCSRSADK